jgi:pimeloyl-ACP methyl ester carboxylesterase
MKPFDGRSEQDRRLNAAQAALLERYAPDTRVRRVPWSQGETQVLELGSGPPLLLVHGGGDGAFEWVPILPALARTHRVLAVDRPGHGLADPFDYRRVDLLDHARSFLRDILDALELPAVDIAASSMGALWSVALALDTPSRVSGLVIIGHPPGVNGAAPLPLRMIGLPLLGRPLGWLMMGRPSREGNRRFWGQVLVAHPEYLDDAFLDVDVAHTRRNLGSILGLIRRAIGIWGVRRPLILGKRWEALKVRTLFLRGERDAFVGPRVAKAWEDIGARNPNVRIVRIPGAGHIAWIDDPERVVDELEHFLATPVGPRRAPEPMTGASGTPAERTRAIDVKRRVYAKEAPKYDREADFTERWLLGTEHRGWACSKATGDTLEVAIGTGLNLPHYPPDVRLTGVDLSPEMLALAVTRAQEMGRTIGLTEGDAEDLPFADRSFDTVVCTYAMCSVRDDARAISEMHRVLRTGGRLILVDHIRSSVPPIFWLQ